jgi:hypothetical protein
LLVAGVGQTLHRSRWGFNGSRRGRLRRRRLRRMIFPRSK